MNYATTSNRPNPAAAMGALGVPAGFGALLIFGLAVTATISVEDGPLVSIEVPIEEADPIPDPQPEESSASNTATQTQTIPDVVLTRPESDLNFEWTDSDPVTTLPTFGDGIGEEIGPVDFTIPTPAQQFDPVAATPRGNASRWITDNDYRTSWINRGYSGVAAFSLEIDANGRVSDCTITQSTGHSALDTATCRLLQNRARFNPAQDASGNIVAGTYNSSVNWKIPE